MNSCHSRRSAIIPCCNEYIPSSRITTRIPNYCTPATILCSRSSCCSEKQQESDGFQSSCSCYCCSRITTIICCAMKSLRSCCNKPTSGASAVMKRSMRAMDPTCLAPATIHCSRITTIICHAPAVMNLLQQNHYNPAVTNSNRSVRDSS